MAREGERKVDSIKFKTHREEELEEETEREEEGERGREREKRDRVRETGVLYKVEETWRMEDRN